VKNISYSKIKEIRESEFQVQEYTEKDREQSKKDYQNGKKITFFKLVFTTLKKTAYIADLHQIPSEERFKNFQRDPEKCPIKMHNLLVITMNEDQPIEINFYGECKYIKEFSELTKQSNAIYETWESSPRESGGFWGAKSRIEGKVVGSLLNSVLSSLLGPDRPYLKFSTVFMYPFKIKNHYEFTKEINTSDFWEKSIAMDPVYLERQASRDD